MKMRSLQLVVSNNDELNFLTDLDFYELLALFVDEEVGDLRRCLDEHLPGVLLHRMFFDQTQGRQRQRFDAANTTVAIAAWADDLGRFAQRRTQTLTRQFKQAEARDATDLHAGAIDLHRVLELVLNLALVARAVHVDEVDDNQTAGIADAQLACDLGGGFKIGIERGVFDVAALGRLRRVDVDGGQRFSLVDDDRATGRQTHRALERILDLRFNLKARKQRHSVLIQLELAQIIRHHLLNELASVVVEFLVIDQDLADIIAQVVAQRADDELGFLINQERCRARSRSFSDRLPQLQQIIEIPLQLFGFTAHACGADDQAHFFGQLQFIHGVFEVLPILAFDAA